MGLMTPSRVAVENGEATLTGVLLLLENVDVPGIVGLVGSILGRHGVNIAAMNLGRNEAGGTALSVINVDTAPSAEAMRELQAPEQINRAMLVRF